MNTQWTTAELVEMLRSPEPLRRDSLGYDLLVRRIADGAEDARLGKLGGALVAMLGDEQVHARSFAAVVLARLVTRDAAVAAVDLDQLGRWRERVADWYLAETDLRGWDDELGWLHPVAHGADALRAFGVSRRIPAAAAADLLNIAARRLVLPTDYLFAHQEDDRVALAIAVTLTRPDLTVDQAVGWLAAVRNAFATGRPGPVPAWAANTMRTLRMTYLLVDRGLQLDRSAGAPPLRPQHRGAVLDAIAEVLRQITPDLG